MAATIAAIAAGVSALTGVGSAIAGGRGSSTRQGIYGDAYDQSSNDAIQAAISAAMTGQLGRAGFTDSAGSSLKYDPVTNTWVSALGELPQAAQTASDKASIERNTTDIRQTQRTNAMSERNATAAQPMIDAAMRRFQDFRPMTADTLSADLTERAVDANNTVYNPQRQALLSQMTRTGTGDTGQLATLGTAQSGDLRRAILDSRIAATTGVDQINNTRRQGLSSDLQTAIGAGTPNFQYPGIVPSTNNKDMLAAINNRATGAAYSNALGQSALASANKLRGEAAGNLAGSYPATDPFLSGLYSSGQQINNLFKDKNVQGTLDNWFGPTKAKPEDDMWANLAPGRFSSNDDTF